MIIKTHADHKQALLDVEKYFISPPLENSQEDAEFDRLFNAIEAYEDIHYPIGDDEEKRSFESDFIPQPAGSK
jgi:antitoxin component HigA of HigAB toxin-antitoxin module